MKKQGRKYECRKCGQSMPAEASKEGPQMSDYAPDDLEKCCPGAMVRHVYDAEFYVMNGGMTRSAPMNKRTVHFECATCGRKLNRKTE